MAKLMKLETAQELALRGDVKSATALFKELETEGDVLANAALAEISAYKGKWNDVLNYAAKVFDNPLVIETYNVFFDLVMLVARAGDELKEWKVIEGLGKAALKNLKNVERYQSHIEVINRLLFYADRKGDDSFFLEEVVEEETKQKFENGLKKLKEKKKQFKNESARLNHLYGMARAYKCRSAAVSLYDESSDLPDVFDNIVFLASALAGVGRKKEAWGIIKSKLTAWWPVEDSQIAPVVLLTDEFIKLLMSKSKCEEVLRLPKGSGT